MAARHEISSFDFGALEPLGPGRVCGIDEAGRGALAGPVVAACVTFIAPPPAGLADSKALTPKRREALFELIHQVAVVGVGLVDNTGIDRHGILPANFMAMASALRTVRASSPIVRVVVDGNYLAPSFVEEFGSLCMLRCMVKADVHVQEVCAASIVAKVTRDRLMSELAPRFSVYGFDRNAGYPSPPHLSALKQHGSSVLHRHSFAPVAAAAAAERAKGLVAASH